MVTATNIIDPDVALNEAAASQMLGINVRTLQAWRFRGQGPRYLKMGRCVRYRRQDLLAFAEQCVARPITDAARAHPSAIDEINRAPASCGGAQSC